MQKGIQSHYVYKKRKTFIIADAGAWSSCKMCWLNVKMLPQDQDSLKIHFSYSNFYANNVTDLLMRMKIFTK